MGEGIGVFKEESDNSIDRFDGMEVGAGGGQEVEAKGGERGGKGEKGFGDELGIEEGGEVVERRDIREGGDEFADERARGGGGGRGGDGVGEDEGKEGAWPSHAVITLWLNERRII